MQNVTARNSRWLVVVILLLELAVIVVGFSRSYFSRGLVFAPLPGFIVHLHGALMSLWYLVFLVQAVLIASGKRANHRLLGVMAFALMPFIFITGLLVSSHMLSRNATAGGFDPFTFSVIPFSGMLAFASFGFVAWRFRRDHEVHWRLLLISSAGMTTAAFARWPLPFFWVDYYRAYDASYIFLLLLIAYDFITRHRIHRATWLGSLCLIMLDQSTRWTGPSLAWHQIAAWLQSLKI